jgi:hypothetical protein
MAALDSLQALCRMVPRPRPKAGGGPAALPDPVAPTELVGGRWQVIGTGRGIGGGTPARLGRRMAQGAAPLAATATVTGGTILVCRAAGLPDPMPGPVARQPTAEAVPGAAGTAATLDSFAPGGAFRLTMSGPSIFRPDGPYQDRLRLLDEVHTPAQQAPVAVPEPSSVALFGGFLLLLTCVLVGTGQRRRATSRQAAHPQPARH